MDNRKFAERQKRAYKFNIIDLVLIIVILAAVAVLIYIMLGNSLLAGKEETTIIYTIEVPQIKNELIPAINEMSEPGTKVIDSVRNFEIGEIVKVQIEDVFSNEMDPEAGVVFRKPYPDHSKIIITIKAKCIKNKVRYTINGKTIMVGVQMNFRTPTFVSYGNCTYIVEVNENGSKKSGDTTETETGGDMGGE